jgi:hypothetical protein
MVEGTGHLPIAGRWQMTVTHSDERQCLGFERLDGGLGVVHEDCGWASFDAVSIGGGDELRDTTVVFGPASE